MHELRAANIHYEATAGCKIFIGIFSIDNWYNKQEFERFSLLLSECFIRVVHMHNCFIRVSAFMYNWDCMLLIRNYIGSKIK